MEVLKGIQRVAVCDLFWFFPKKVLYTFKLRYMKIRNTLSVNTRKIIDYLMHMQTFICFQRHIYLSWSQVYTSILVPFDVNKEVNVYCKTSLYNIFCIFPMNLQIKEQKLPDTYIRMIYTQSILIIHIFLIYKFIYPL